MTTPHPDWQTNSIVKMFGSDLNVESIVLPIAREGDLYNNAKNEIGFSKNIPKSGGSLLYEDDVPSYYFKLFGDDSPVIRHFVNDPPYDPDAKYAEFVGACGAENIERTTISLYEMVINIAFAETLVISLFQTLKSAMGTSTHSKYLLIKKLPTRGDQT